MCWMIEHFQSNQFFLASRRVVEVLWALQAERRFGRSKGSGKKNTDRD